MKDSLLYPAGRYNLNFDVCSVLLCLFILILFLTRKNLRIRRIRSFITVLIGMMLSSYGELCVDIIRNGVNVPVWEAELATFVSHVAHNSIPYLLVFYFLAVTGLWHGLTKKKLAWLNIPEIILIITHVIPVFRHQIYYYDSSLGYHRGPLYSIYIILIVYYIVIGLVILISRFSAIRKKDRAYIIVLGSGFIFSMVLGYVDRYLRMTNFLQTLFLTGCFFALENDEALTDMETGLYNTQALIRDAHPLFESHYDSQIIAVKLQHFDYYRLMIGNAALNRVLHDLGLWMKKMGNDTVTFYRIGHGEFAVILFNHPATDADALAEKIRERFRQPWLYTEGGASVTIPAQIWMSSIPDRISSEEQLLVFTESVYDASLPEERIYVADEIKKQQRAVDVDVAIRRALNEHTFEVYYQPIYDTKEKKIHSCEALVRMNDPQLGFVSPEEFIKIAEQTGTVSRIGEIVFEKVCAFLAKEKPEQYGMDFVEVNLSTIQCMDEHLPKRFAEIMKQYEISPDRIVLEITESAVIHNEGRMQKAVSDLKQIGFRFALDDFGTGRANYSYILNFPFHIIKIDKSFLWSADKSETNSVILKNMLDLVHQLRLETVVEGVETEKQRDDMIREGVSYLQGYYYSRPVPADAFLAYLKQFNEN